MEIIGNFFDALAYVISIVLNLYFWIVIISALLSWVRPDPYNPIVRFLYAVTEPVYRRIRSLMPFIVISGFDLSPIVVIIVIQFLQIFLVNTLRSLAV
ncbi:YggT family protein [Desulfovibrio inopinatus]|uniref:YggT family protein n=1 Tax=Desulfovibrio inopinatus TaxID=102109 RepID=UPI0004213DCB|nr:YggT family protein [Desulfovibrio inopinatus]